MNNGYKFIKIPEFCGDGCLSFIENDTHIPFSIARVFYIYDVPRNAKRGEHAHKECEQFIFSLNGSFDVFLHNGTSENRYRIYEFDKKGIYVGTHVWVKLCNFALDAICVVLASKKYDKDDYINNFNEFKELCNES